MKEFSSWLKAVRIRKSLSQKELSKLSGLPQSAVSVIENRKRNPTLRTLNRLCEAMHVPVINGSRDEELLQDWDRHRIDKVARQVITGERGLAPLENDLADRLDLICLTKLRVAGIPRHISNRNKRFFVAKRWCELKELYPKPLIENLLKRIDKYLWKYTYEKR